MRNFETIIIPTVVVALQTVLARYYVNRRDTSWDYENPPCMLATPEIVYSSDGPTISLQVDIDIASDEKVLVGYTKTFEAMEYVGCIWKGDLPEGVQIYSTRSDPGECYSACQTEDFGIYDRHCYCFTKAPERVHYTYPYCVNKCSDPQNTVCGGSHLISSYVSWYKRVEMSSQGPDDGKNCRIYDEQSDSFTWQNCDRKLNGLCQKGHNNTPFSATEFYSTTASIHWYQYPRICFENDLYPLVESKSQIAIFGDSKLWVGGIKSWTIAAVNDAKQENTSYGYYGYISKENGKFVLQFTKSKNGSVLCKKDTMTTAMTTTTTTLITEAASTLPPTKTVSQTLKDSTDTGLETSETTTKGGNVTSASPDNLDTNEKGRAEEQHSPMPIVVYVIIPLVLLVGGAVAFFIIRRKRKHSTAKVIKDTEVAKGFSRPSHANARGLTNVTYANGFIPDTLGNQNNDQIVLGPEYENTVFHRQPLAETKDQCYITTRSANNGETNITCEYKVNCKIMETKHPPTTYWTTVSRMQLFMNQHLKLENTMNMILQD